MKPNRIPRAARPRFATILLALLLLAAGPGRVPAQPTYTIDTDPIRLGNRAFDAGNLDEAHRRYQEAVDADYQTARALLGLAQIAVRQGRYRDAEPLFRQSLDRNSDSGEARAGLGLLLFRSGQPGPARAELDRALAVKPDLWEAAYGLARLALAEGRVDEAEPLLRKGAGRHGLREGEDLYHHGMALLHLQRGDLNGAESEALVALSLNPGEPDYGTLVGTVYERKNVPSLAIGAYEQALAAPGITATALTWHTLGRLYQKVERYTEARDSYLKAVEADSTYSPALRDLGDLLRLAKQNDRALRTWRRYVQLEPADVTGWLAVSQVALDLQQPAQALDAARSAMTIDSTRIDVRMAWARAGLRSGDRAVRGEAARLFSTVADSAGWKPADWLALATARSEARQFVEARSALDRAVAVDAKNADAWFQYGLVEMNAGRPDSAEARFQAALALRPDAALTWLNLGIARLQARRNQEAVSALRRAVALDSTQASGRLMLAQALALSDSLKAAETEYRRLIEREPANARALRGLAYCQIRRGAYGEAARSYRASAEAEPGNADGWAGLGNAYLGLQKWDAAGEAFQRARAIDPNNASMKKGLELLEKARAGTTGG